MGLCQCATTTKHLYETSVKILRNDWLKQKNEICNAYINALRKADKEVIIVGSYFLPGRRLSNALKKAARNGVKIKIIFSGVSDLPIVMWATNFLYSSLLRQGIELLEWKKSVLHGKLALVDNNWTTIGSFNLNHLSSYGSIEMNVYSKETGLQKIKPELVENFQSSNFRVQFCIYQYLQRNPSIFL